jgi:hypothetical protein
MLKQPHPSLHASELLNVCDNSQPKTGLQMCPQLCSILILILSILTATLLPPTYAKTTGCDTTTFAFTMSRGGYDYNMLAKFGITNNVPEKHMPPQNTNLISLSNTPYHHECTFHSDWLPYLYLTLYAYWKSPKYHNTLFRVGFASTHWNTNARYNKKSDPKGNILNPDYYYYEDIGYSKLTPKQRPQNNNSYIHCIRCEVISNKDGTTQTYYYIEIFCAF